MLTIGVSLILILTTFAEVTTVNGNPDSSTQSELSSKFTNLGILGPLLGGVAVAVGLPISAITSYYQRKQQRLNSMIEIFKLLNNEEHRKARRKVYAAYTKGEIADKVTDDLNVDISIVRADFDQVGILVENKFVPKKMLLEAYWNTVLVSWKSLEDHIQRERTRRDYPSYMKYFEGLRKDAYRYWKKYHPETRHIKVWSEDSNT